MRIMSTKPKSYLNQMLSQLPNGCVATSIWLKSLGISNDLQQSYKRNGWLKSIGKGAFVKYNDEATAEGAIYTLQKQLNLKVHIGASSALAMHNFEHFATLAFFPTQLFTADNIKLPKWFVDNFIKNAKNPSKTQNGFFKTSLFSTDVGIKIIEQNGLELQISTPERAFLEELYIAPEYINFSSIYQMLELAVNLQPELLQELLENCNSIKIKRLFLYMAENISHEWFAYLNLSKINLGSGKRVISKGGKLDKKYNIVIEDLDRI